MVAVEMKNIVKNFGKVVAVNDATFELEQGEIHSLLGENGAGKSTLMNMLFGMFSPTSGDIIINGKTVHLKSPKDAIKLGVGMVHQHFMLVPVMTVAENIVVGNEPDKGFLFSQKLAEKKVDDIIKKYSFNISSSKKVSELSVGEQQKVEILKAIYRGAEILILDEPTAVLTPQEVKELFVIMRELKSAGKSIIIITHKLRETMEIADRISVLRDGVMINTGVDIHTVDIKTIAGMMVGRNVNMENAPRTENATEVLLDVQNLNLTKNNKKILNNITFAVKKGEILGIAGIEGNGQSELIDVLTGLRQPDEKSILIDKAFFSGDPADFIRAGVGHIPEDRLKSGLVANMSIGFNIILGYQKNEKFQRRGIFKKSQVSTYANELIESYGIKADKETVLCSNLSGGNQQKVVVARVFSQNPDIIIVAQPTRGVDIGAMEYIHKRLIELRDSGKSIVLISADLDEVRKLSDRIAVIYEGEMVSFSNADELSETELGMLMLGSSTEKAGGVS